MEPMHATPSSSLPRRAFVHGAGAAGISLAAGAIIPARTRSAVAQADVALRITPVSLEPAPGKVIKTFGYNDQAPGPVLRLAEGRPVSIHISNGTDIDDIIHWHGLYVPSDVDGAMEEGSPAIPHGDRGSTPSRRNRRAPAGITAITSPEKTWRGACMPACSVFSSSSRHAIPGAMTGRCCSPRITGKAPG